MYIVPNSSSFRSRKPHPSGSFYSLCGMGEYIMMTNLVPGLVSISFRQLQPEEIVRLCRDCGLRVVEWGGDVHVPHGNLQAAENVAALMRQSGLQCAAYGSYYRCGVSPREEFSGVLECANILNAPFIRVWAGNKASGEISAAERAAVVADLQRCVYLAAAAGMRVSTEYHSGTLTDTVESCDALLADCPGLSTGWQPPVGMAPEACCAALQKVLPRLSTIHAFHWRQRERLPLADGAAVWRQYLKLLDSRTAATAVLLEFVRDDSPEQLRQDAGTLQELLSAL